jgi:hypothetical protein
LEISHTKEFHDFFLDGRALRRCPYRQTNNRSQVQHRTNERVNFYGKATIVKAVLEAETKSKLYIDRNKGQKFYADQVRGTWFVKFMYALGRSLPKEDVREIFNNVSFVIFNYDRCIEHFLWHALQ